MLVFTTTTKTTTTATAVCCERLSISRRTSMSQNQSGGTPGQQSSQQSGQPSDHESVEEKAKREAGVTEHSSHNHTARERAGSHEGAGGGAKQKQNH
jgi:hypothetical protein